jgi:hypothetical protein
MLLETMICSAPTGTIGSAFSQYMPFVYFAPVVATVAGGLAVTLQVDSSHGKYIGYQALYGIGLGLGMSQPMMTVQAIPGADMPSATGIVMYMKSMGAAVFVSAARNRFHNKLLENLTNDICSRGGRKPGDGGWGDNGPKSFERDLAQGPASA